VAKKSQSEHWHEQRSFPLIQRKAIPKNNPGTLQNSPKTFPPQMRGRGTPTTQRAQVVCKEVELFSKPGPLGLEGSPEVWKANSIVGNCQRGEGWLTMGASTNGRFSHARVRITTVNHITRQETTPLWVFVWDHRGVK